MTLDESIRGVQTKLGVEADGRPGPQTWNAIYRRIIDEPPTTVGTTKTGE